MELIIDVDEKVADKVFWILENIKGVKIKNDLKSDIKKAIKDVKTGKLTDADDFLKEIKNENKYN